MFLAKTENLRLKRREPTVHLILSLAKTERKTRSNEKTTEVIFEAKKCSNTTTTNYYTTTFTDWLI